MNTFAKSAESTAREVKFKNDAFDKWLSEPLVRMGISAIPAGENKDALMMLLRSAYDAGCGAGSGVTALSFVEAILDNQDRRPRL